MEISAVLIAFNEERNIEAALQSLEGVADEIVVVDSHSTDRTVKIARKYTDRVFERTWTNYADQKNFADDQADHLWILSLDADERLSPELRAEILGLKDGTPDCRRFLHAPARLLSRPLDPALRLVSRPADPALPPGRRPLGGRVRPRKPRPRTARPSACPGDIHAFHLPEHRRPPGPDQRLLRASAPRSSTPPGGRRAGTHLVFLPPARFLKSYVVRLGFLDGFAGLVIAVLTGYAIFAPLREAARDLEERRAH